MPLSENTNPQFTEEEILELRRNNVWAVAEHLYQGDCTMIYVADEEEGRSLVEGEKPLLKQVIEAMTRLWGPGPLNSDTVRFLMMDFHSSKEPEEILKRFLQKISKVNLMNPTNFNILYPGNIVVILGAELIPAYSSVHEIYSITKSLPCLFITIPGKDGKLNYKNLNRTVFRAIGENLFLSCTYTAS